MSPERKAHKEEEKADQLKFNLFQTTENPTNQSTSLEMENKINEGSLILSGENEKKGKKKPTKEELKHEKKYFRQLWELEGKNEVHARMQKRPANDPRVVHPLQVFIEQERNDSRKFRKKKYIRGFRLLTNPDIVLTDEQFSKYCKWVMSLSEEEKINLALTNAEIYDRKVLARKIAYNKR